MYAIRSYYVLGSANPDVLCMQETKVEDDKFPEEALGDAGYRVVHLEFLGHEVLAHLALGPGEDDGQEVRSYNFV